MTYEDTQIVLNDNNLEIKRYYFPIGTSKFIKFSDIKGIKEIDLNLLNGRGRIWGMGFHPYWYNMDNNRFLKKKGILLNLGKNINPVITPDNYNLVIQLIKDKVI